MSITTALGFLPPEPEGAYIARYHLLMWSQELDGFTGIATMILTDGPIMQYADAVTAYVQTENWMIRSTMTGACTPSGTVYTCGLTLANGKQALAVWDTADRVHTPSGLDFTLTIET